jgi:hypothetical protein
VTATGLSTKEILMTHPPEDAYHDANRDFNRFVVVCLTIAALAALSYATLAYAPATNFGELAWKLTFFVGLGGFLTFLVSVYTAKSGGSGNLGLALLFMFVQLLVVALFLLLEGVFWPHGSEMLHARAQWILMGLQSIYLLFVTWN